MHVRDAMDSDYSFDLDESMDSEDSMDMFDPIDVVDTGKLQEMLRKPHPNGRCTDMKFVIGEERIPALKSLMAEESFYFK